MIRKVAALLVVPTVIASAVWVSLTAQQPGSTDLPIESGAASSTKFGMVESGHSHSCAMSTNGEVFCWGSNKDGQVDPNSYAPYIATAVQVRGLLNSNTAGMFDFATLRERVMGVDLGWNYSCAEVSKEDPLDGQFIQCWGYVTNVMKTNTKFRAGTYNASTVAVNTFAAGSYHACSIETTNANIINCAGENEWEFDGLYNNGCCAYGMSDFEKRENYGARTPVGVSFEQVAAGYRFACALTTDGQTYCWGANESGQAGSLLTDFDDYYPGNQSLTWPTLIENAPKFTSLSAGSYHTCALTSEGEAFCWGDNEYGQLGHGNASDADVPIAVTTQLRFKSISAGGFHTCGLTLDNRGYCWGFNGVGALGVSGEEIRNTPSDEVQGNQRFAYISAGWGHTCGVTEDGRVLCWGFNEAGQLGDNTLANSNTPVEVVVTR